MAVENGLDAGILQGNGINDAKMIARRAFNTFGLPEQRFLTSRFGQLTPFLCEDVVPNDTFDVSSIHELKTYTLGQVMMSSVKMDKDYFFVPMEAILPHGWKYFFKPPVHGDDVEPLKVGCKFPFKKFVNERINSIKDNVKNSAGNFYSQFSEYAEAGVFAFLYDMQSLYYMLGSGTVMDMLGFRVSENTDAKYRFYRVFDEAMRDFWDKFWTSSNFTMIYRIYSDSQTAQDIVLSVGENGNLSEFRTFLWFLFESGFTVSIQDGGSEFAAAAQEAYESSLLKAALSAGWISVNDAFPDYIDVRRLVAYQLTCTQFYSNDRVDNIFNADLWHHNYQALVLSCDTTSDSKSSFEKWFYTYNGSKVQYDSVSGFAFDFLCSFTSISNLQVLYNIGASSDYSKWYNIALPWACIHNLFGFANTLKYNDYFYGSKLQPLAVGDVNAPVVGNNVSAVDTTKSILMQRFLHAVNRIGSSVTQFKESIFGNSGKQYCAEPRYLVHDTYNIIGQEVESTYGSGNVDPAQNQGYIVTNLKSSAQNYAFRMSFDEHGVLLGLSVIRSREVYSRGVHRSWFWQDRYDEFNPMLQSIGDQMVSTTEFTGETSLYERAFGYQDRNAEYKQSYSTCHGGFSSGALKSWAYLHDHYFECEQKLNSESLRFRPTTFDRFFTVLSALYFGDYFHFVISMVNSVKANRQMDYHTKILDV